MNREPVGGPRGRWWGSNPRGTEGFKTVESRAGASRFVLNARVYCGLTDRPSDSIGTAPDRSEAVSGCSVVWLPTNDSRRMTELPAGRSVPLSTQRCSWLSGCAAGSSPGAADPEALDCGCQTWLVP